MFEAGYFISNDIVHGADPVRINFQSVVHQKKAKNFANNFPKIEPLQEWFVYECADVLSAVLHK